MQFMQAAILEEINQPLVVKAAPIPEASVGEVIVRLKAAALNHRDVWAQKGRYPGMKLPCVLGSDGVGIVETIGKGLDRTMVGREVVINPGLFWGNDLRLQSKEFRILGLPDDGTFAQYIKIPASNVLPKPSTLTFEETAALPLAGLTAYRALFTRAQLQAGEKVLITGIGGGVALFALQFAVAAGAQVYVTSSSEAKINQAMTLGATGGVNYKEENWHKQLLEKVAPGTKNVFDVIIDGAGGEGFMQLIELAALGGRIVLYGATRGPWKEILAPRVFFKQLAILGTTMGSAPEFEAMLRFVEEKRIKPVVDQSFPLIDVQQAMDRMAKGDQFGKIVLQIS